MGLLDRRRIVLGLALILCLSLLGRWATRPDDAGKVRPAAEDSAFIAGSPGSAPAPALAGAAADVPPATDDPISKFGTLRGRVIDAVTRAPVPEFEVEFQGTQPTKVGDEAPGARRFRAVDGRFEWQYVPPGRWTVTASAPGYQRFELIDLLISSGDTAPEIVLPLRRGYRLRGRVYDELSGAGIASASVSFRESDVGRFEDDFRSRVRVSSAKDGSFVLEGVPAGRVTLDVDAQDYAGRELTIAVDDDASPLEIALSAGGTIAGHLAGADGVTPVAGSAGLFNLDDGFGGTGRTGEAGEFSFQHLAPGRYQLTGQAEGGSATREIVLARNQRIEGIVLALSAGRSIRGVVTGLRPADLKRVSISLRGGRDAGNPYAEVGVDEGGGFVLPSIQPGPVQVVADVSMRRQVSRTIEMPANSDITIQLDFPPGARLSGRVTRDGKPLSNLSIEPRPVVEHDVYVYGASTSEDGSFVIEDLADGEYHVMAGTYRSKLVRVSGDTVFDIDVPLAQLSGRVLEETGKVPLVGATVDLWPAEPGSSGSRRYGQSDHFGQF